MMNFEYETASLYDVVIYKGHLPNIVNKHICSV